MHHLVVHITIAYQDWLGSVTVGRQPPRPAGLTRWKCPMPGPAPTYQPTFTPEQVADCARLVRQHRAPQLQVARAKLALLLRDDPTMDHPTAARQLGKHPNWVRGWRRRWVHESFRLSDKPGRGRKPTFSPPAGGDGQGAGLRAAGTAGRTAPPLQHRRTPRLVSARPDAPAMSLSTIWRTLDRDALKPWRQRSWLFPRAPQF